jgi:Na+/H+-dicarboxylate symporter
MMAMATCSGAATMPLNVTNTEKYFGVPSSFSTMIISIGTVITNGGSNVYKAGAVYFLATLYGVNIGLPQIFTIILVTSFVVTAGVPAAGTLTAAIILNSLGAPIEGIALLMGIDRLRDMISTAGNVTVQSMASITLYNLMEKDVASQTTTDIGKAV